MARVFTCGFEDGADYYASDIIPGGTNSAVTNSSVTLSFGAVRCIKIINPFSIAGREVKIIPQVSSYDLSDIYARIWVYNGSLSNTSRIDIRIRDSSGTTIVDLNLQNGDVSVCGNLEDTLGSLLSVSWVRYEFHIIVGAVGTVTIRRDGAVIYSDTNIDTTASGASEVGYIGCNVGRTTSNPTIYFDDIAVNDTTGVVDTTYPGDARIIGLLPTAAGANTNMTPLSGDNYANVDDAQSSGNDGDTTYVSAATSQELDSYEFESIATKYPALPSNTAIARVTMMAVCRTPTVGLDIRGVVVDGGTENGVVVTPEGTSSYGINGSVVTHPDGSWTYARVESAEFGIESI